MRIAPPGTDVRNPAFDVTPAELITGIVTEEGVVRAPYGDGLAAATDAARAPVGGDAGFHALAATGGRAGRRRPRTRHARLGPVATRAAD